MFPTTPFVDVTITSPPYWNLKDYASKKQIGHGQTYDQCLDDLQRVFRGVFDITKNSGSLWIVVDTIKAGGELKPYPFDLSQRLKTVGWLLQDIIIWNKDKTLPWSHRGKLRNIFEYILFFSKSHEFQYYLNGVRQLDDLKSWWVRYPERYSPAGKAPARTWNIPIPRQGSWGDNWVRHFCPLPPELVARIIRLTTRPQNIVLDPFSGSGVVLAVAKASKRRFVGLDLSKKCQTMFTKKVLPSIMELERQRAQLKNRMTSKRKIFSEAIWRLRKLKFPKELQRLYEEQHRRLPVRFVHVASHARQSIDLTLALDGPLRVAALADLKALTRRPPLSKYGLKVTLRPMLAQTAIRHLAPCANKLSCFLNGNTTVPAKVPSLEKILITERDGDRFSPIISSIKPQIWRKLRKSLLP